MTHENKAIWFNRKDGTWGVFSNFAGTPFRLDGRSWATAEHYFQAMKATCDADRDKVADAGTPGAAKQMGRKITLRKDWERVKEDVMRRALRAKFEQNEGARLNLMESGDRPIHEDAEYDPYWGGQGKDRLGALLMELREALAGEGE